MGGSQGGALSLIGACRSPASAESLTSRRGQRSAADARSRRTSVERRSGHVHPGLVAPPGAGDRVGALARAQSVPRWPLGQ